MYYFSLECQVKLRNWENVALKKSGFNTEFSLIEFHFVMENHALFALNYISRRKTIP